ncbi:MAG TPA: dihydropteroate synthase [Spirochaetota bacterium]|nr:dihydropteroate synthase [Spirochaetota bacterium]HPS87681.1 dihydropteroate synthase [Spirochaetota bacterium]
MNSFRKTRIMGILNITPDSFYDGGMHNSIEKGFSHALKMSEDGADIIDVGGESTRPGSLPVSVSEEIDRVVPVIERIVKEISIPVSIDTTKSQVAVEAVKAGASIINDISGLTFDPAIIKAAADYKTWLIISHIKGTPYDMQKNTGYNDIIKDILDFLNIAINNALDQGVSREKIILDPGIGFGKSQEQNYIILNNIMKIRETGYPVLIGLSRKSLIGKLYNYNEEDRLPATIALNAVAVNNGADIVRVHDVKAHRLAMDSIDFLKRTVSE